MYVVMLMCRWVITIFLCNLKCRLCGVSLAVYGLRDVRKKEEKRLKGQSSCNINIHHCVKHLTCVLFFS